MSYTLYSECDEIEAMYYQLVCKGQTPLLPLDSLEDEAKMTGGYVVPPKVSEKLPRYRAMKEKCKATEG